MTAKEDLRAQRISVLFHTAAGILIGVAAPFFSSGYHVLALSIAIAVILGHLTQKVVGRREFKWWMANGLLIYFLVVADVWIFIANYF
jgi:hypothetical protein